MPAACIPASWSWPHPIDALLILVPQILHSCIVCWPIPKCLTSVRSKCLFKSHGCAWESCSTLPWWLLTHFLICDQMPRSTFCLPAPKHINIEAPRNLCGGSSYYHCQSYVDAQIKNHVHASTQSSSSGRSMPTHDCTHPSFTCDLSCYAHLGIKTILFSNFIFCASIPGWNISFISIQWCFQLNPLLHRQTLQSFCSSS